MTKNKLDVATPSDREIRVTRSFDAPRQFVWDCHTKPELVQRWMLGPDGWSMPVCEIDLRVGGTYLYRWRNDESGREFDMTGEFRELAPVERIVHSERFEENESQVTLLLDETRGRTMMTMTIAFASKEARDGALATGMTDGMETGYQRLDAMAAEQARAS